jgi:hypothetical protein
VEIRHVYEKAMVAQEIDAYYRKTHCSQQKVPPVMVTMQDRSPQQGMRRPLAAVRVGPNVVSDDSHGMIEKADPVSTT